MEQFRRKDCAVTDRDKRLPAFKTKKGTDLGIQSRYGGTLTQNAAAYGLSELRFCEHRRQMLAGS